jgi:hypothetical protein
MSLVIKFTLRAEQAMKYIVLKRKEKKHEAKPISRLFGVGCLFGGRHDWMQTPNRYDGKS